MVSFMPWPLYPQEKSPQYLLDRGLGGYHIFITVSFKLHLYVSFSDILGDNNVSTLSISSTAVCKKYINSSCIIGNDHNWSFPDCKYVNHKYLSRLLYFTSYIILIFLGVQPVRVKYCTHTM